MKKLIYILLFQLIALCGLVFANRKNKIEAPEKQLPKSLTDTERNEVLRKWEASPDGIMYKKWEASPMGKKVYESESKIRKSIGSFTNMGGIVTSLSLPSGSRLGFGMMVRIKGEDFILAFGPEKHNDSEFVQLHQLKVNDKIIIRSHSVSHAPKYSYPILSGDYIELDNKIIYSRKPNKGSC